MDAAFRAEMKKPHNLRINGQSHNGIAHFQTASESIKIWRNARGHSGLEENDKSQLFEEKGIRTAWDEECEKGYFSIADAAAVLTEQPDTRHASTYRAGPLGLAH